MKLTTAFDEAFRISQYIVAVITKLRNCIWENVEITAKNRLLIQLFTTVQILCY